MLSQRPQSTSSNSSGHVQAAQSHLHAPPQGEVYLCAFDFDTTAPDQLSFRQNDVLTIIHKEQSGWWAALHGGRLKWVPASYLTPIPARKGLAPPTVPPSSSPSSLASPLSSTGNEADLPVYTEEDEGYQSPDVDPYDPSHRVSSEYTDGPTTPIPQFSPTDPLVGDLSNKFASANLRGSKSSARSSGAPVPPSYAMYSPPSATTPVNYVYPRSSSSSYSMSPPYDPPIPHQLSLVLEEGSDVNSQWSMPSMPRVEEYAHRNSVGSSRGPLSSPSSSTTADSAALQMARLSQANLPWYLRPKYTWEELKVDANGLVIAGTVPALIERLLLDPLKATEEQSYRTIFLTTFKSFTTANNVYDTLISYYEMEPPPNLDPPEFLEWKEKKFRPTQTRILSVISQWVDKHAMHIDDPQLIPKLRTFLGAIQSPTGLAISAKQLLQTLDRVQTEDVALRSIPSSSPSSSFSLRRKAKAPKGEFLKWDSADIANHLTIMETRLYSRIRPHECLSWSRSTKGPAVANLAAFIGTSDRIAAWVKLSVLTCESLGKRADTIDHWIKIAENCKKQNNIFSMCAIVAALSGGDIGKLHLTWAHVLRAATLEQLVHLTDPTGRFAAYKALHASLDGPCVPFISIFLTELVHAHEHHPDFMATPAPPEPDLVTPRPLINVMKLRRLGEIIGQMLKFVNKPYRNLVENPTMTSAIEQQIELAVSKDAGFFWQRSQELQGTEVTHADIWRNLNDAGF